MPMAWSDRKYMFRKKRLKAFHTAKGLALK
jgi:hypothetical protein